MYTLIVGNKQAGTYATEAEAQAAGAASRRDYRVVRPIVATWSGEAYVAGDWRSDDGDDWTDGCGEPCGGAEFSTATIVLSGGPRDGELVG